MPKSRGFLRNLIKPLASKSSKGQEEEADLEKLAAQEQKDFSFETLVRATKNFDPALKLGEGGFGPVYKGELDDGRVIAVKKLSQRSRQGKKEFESESKLLARVQHRNVVNLLGYCVHSQEKLLVYQYVANESLDKILFSKLALYSTLMYINLSNVLLFNTYGSVCVESGRRQILDWKRRYDVITGVAKGLLYLHQEAHCPIIHRDIKASNILLDEKWAPKIADFGMARLYPEDQTHVNTRVAGTNGYMAPEYLMHGHLSEKADVFSFGVVVLELISGLKNSKFNRDPESRNLLEWAYKLYKKQRSLEIVDPIVASSANTEQIATCIQMGLLCVQSDPKSRPDMGRVVLMLAKKPSGSLEEPTRPGHPGSRYRRPTVSASSSSASGASHSFGSSTGTQTDMSGSANSRPDPHGKRPMPD